MSGITEAKLRSLETALAGLKSTKGRAVLPADEVRSIVDHVRTGFAKLEEDFERLRESTDPNLGGWSPAAERLATRIEVRRTRAALKHARALLPELRQGRDVGDELLYLERTDPIREGLCDLISQLENRLLREAIGGKRGGGRDRESEWQQIVVSFAASCCQQRRVTTTLEGPFVTLVATLCGWLGKHLGQEGTKAAVRSWRRKQRNPAPQ